MSLPVWVQYVVALGPLVALVAGLIAAGIAYRTYHHRRRQDRKDEWWRRTQWALDNVIKHDHLARDLGLDVLYLQADSELADNEDQRVIETAANRLLEVLREDAQAGELEVEYDEPTIPDGGER